MSIRGAHYLGESTCESLRKQLQIGVARDVPEVPECSTIFELLSHVVRDIILSTRMKHPRSISVFNEINKENLLEIV